MPEGSDRAADSPDSPGLGDVPRTGQPAAGEFTCSGCGYGVIVEVELPRCPMCSGTTWRQSGWGALGRRATKYLQ
jgi:rubrerythrin